MLFYTVPCYDDKILEAAVSGDLELLQRLRNEVDDDEAFRRKCDFVRELEGLTCLHLAAWKGNVHICRFLIEKVKLDININTDSGETPLVFAAAKGSFRIAEYLIIQGADVNMSNHKGTACLHIAAERGNEEIMQLLLSKGADKEAHSVRGTPLQCAASCGNVESVQFLLSCGANPNSVSHLSDSPLIGAILCRSYECLELLLQIGADPNIVSCGKSPLAVAARENDTRFLRSLLAAGANPNSVTSFMKPIEHAVEVGNIEGVTILFQLTESISSYPNWSIHGIENYFHSAEAKIQRKQRQVDHFKKCDELGKRAANRKDYSEAVEWFSEAIYLQPDNYRLLSNRSMCWAHLHEPKPTFALHDAEACITLRTVWPKGHCRAGAAWMLLKCYNKACAALRIATTLEPKNDEIKKALCLAFKSAILPDAELDLTSTLTFLAHSVPFCPIFYTNLLHLSKEDPPKAMRQLREFMDEPEFFKLF